MFDYGVSVTAVSLYLNLREFLTAPSPAVPDDSRIIDTGKGLLGFHRLAIMGLTSGRACSPSSWTAAMWSATAKFTASDRLKKKL